MFNETYISVMEKITAIETELSLVEDELPEVALPMEYAQQLKDGINEAFSDMDVDFLPD